MARILLPVILAVMALLAASWALGELLRQRKEGLGPRRRLRRR